MAETEVVVVGAGPAGAAAAITLARAGRDVVVVDKASFPRDKCCGDGLTTLALRLYEALGLDPADVPSWRTVANYAIRSPSGRWVELTLPTGQGVYAAVAPRRELDAAFLDVARAAGAKVLDGHAVTDATQDLDGVTITVEGSESIRANHLIGADGMWSPTRKMLATPHEESYRGEWHAFRQYFTGIGPAAANRLVVFFEPDLLPGYVWSFPVGDNQANIGFGIQRGGRYSIQDMKGLWPELLARPHIREVLGAEAESVGPHRAWPIPARVDKVVLARGRALWVGDAAAATDVMTGEGIGQALETGVWAAEAIIDHDGDTAGVRCTYSRRVRRDLQPDHRMSALLIRALRHRKGVRFPLWLVDQSDWTRRNFARWLWEDYPRGLIVTPHRWHRQMFTQPGAYR